MGKLEIHLKICKDDKVQKAYSCSICSLKFEENLEMMMEHANEKHPQVSIKFFILEIRNFKNVAKNLKGKLEV